MATVTGVRAAACLRAAEAWPAATTRTQAASRDRIVSGRFMVAPLTVRWLVVRSASSPDATAPASAVGRRNDAQTAEPDSVVRRNRARREARADPADPGIQFVDRRRRVDERARDPVGEQPLAFDRPKRVELERLVGELVRERLEVGDDPSEPAVGLRERARMLEPPADRRRERLPILEERHVLGPAPHLGDRVGLALEEQAVDE